MTFFFYISYEPKHHFVVYKITLHILTQKNYIIKNRVMSATEHYFAKMSVNDTVSNTSNMASAALLCHLGGRAKKVKCCGRRKEKHCTK
jgi:hypothetical protein